MSLTQNDLKGYIIGTNQFNFQDVRVDDIQTIINNTEGQEGIEVRDNRFALTEGGYYETGVLFEQTGLEIVLSNEGNTDYEYDISGSETRYLEWLNSESPVNILLIGTDGENAIEDELQGKFVISDSVLSFSFDDNNASLLDYGIQFIRIVEENDTINFVIIKDSRNENDLTLNEVAVYLPQSEPVQWGAELLDTQGIAGTFADGISAADGDAIDNLYQAIVARLIDEGYIQSQE